MKHLILVAAFLIPNIASADYIYSFGELPDEQTGEVHKVLFASDIGGAVSALGDAVRVKTLDEVVKAADGMTIILDGQDYRFMVGNPVYELSSATKMARLGYSSPEEGVVENSIRIDAVESEVTSLKGGDGASVLSELVQLLLKQDAVIRAGVSYPNAQKAAVTAYDQERPETASDGLVAALKELGIE